MRQDSEKPAQKMKYPLWLLMLYFICPVVYGQFQASNLVDSKSTTADNYFDPASVPESVEVVKEKRSAFRELYTFPPEEVDTDPVSIRVSRLIYELDAIYENQITALIQLTETQQELETLGDPETWTPVTAVGDLGESITFSQYRQLLAVEYQLRRSQVLAHKEVSRSDSNLSVALDAFQAIQTQVTRPIRGKNLSLKQKDHELTLWTKVEQYALRRLQSRLSRDRQKLTNKKLNLFEPFLETSRDLLIVTEEDNQTMMEQFSKRENELDREMTAAQRRLAQAESQWEKLNRALPEELSPLQAARMVSLDYQRQATLAEVAKLQRSLSYLSIQKESVKAILLYFQRQLSDKEVLAWQDQITQHIKHLGSELEFKETELEQAREVLASRQQQLTVDEPDKIPFFQEAYEAAKELVQHKQDEVAHISQMMIDAENFKRQLQKGTRQWDFGMISSRIGFSIEQIWGFEFFRLNDKPFTVGTLVWISLALIGIVVASWTLAWAVSLLLRLKMNLDSRVSAASRKLLFYLNLVIGVVIVFWLFDFPLSSLAIPTSILALAVGFASQEILKNFMSGIILLLERPIAPGDIIEMSGRVGTVQSIGARSTRLRDFDASEKIIPNSTLLENAIINRTLSDRMFRATIDVGVSYGSPTRKTEQILLEAAAANSGIFPDPKPFVIFDSFGDNALGFRLYFWCAADNRMATSSELRHLIDEKLKEAGIVIAFPQRDIHLDTNGPLEVQLTERPKP